MKCIANVHCQARDENNHIRTFKAGDIFEFPECPKDGNWSRVEEVSLNLSSVSLDVLLATKWHADDLVNYARDNFKVDLSEYESKTKLAEAFVDARYRFEDLGVITPQKEVKPGEVVPSVPDKVVKQMQDESKATKKVEGGK